jgi:hypothetical protein
MIVPLTRGMTDPYLLALLVRTANLMQVLSLSALVFAMPASTVLVALALLALKILPQLLDPLSKLIAIARLTIMEMLKPALTLPPLLQCFDALFALPVVPLLLKHQQLPLPLLLAPALPTPTEMVPHALVALPLLLGPLLDPLPLLLAFAPLTTSELEMETHALFALIVEPLTSNW